MWPVPFFSSPSAWSWDDVQIGNPPPPNNFQWSPLASDNQSSHPTGELRQRDGSPAALNRNAVTSDHLFTPPTPNPNETTTFPHQSPAWDGASRSNTLEEPHVEPLAPPPNPRKRKAPTLREEDWRPVKDRVIELHINQNRPLPEVKKTVEEEFAAIGFSATSELSTLLFQD